MGTEKRSPTEQDTFAAKVEAYLRKGYDRPSAEYFAAGRKKLVDVRAKDDFSLWLTFENGEVRRLDCLPFLRSGTVFEPFMDLENFKRVYLDADRCVSWDIDPEIDSDVVWSNKVDLCPDSCYIDSVPVGAAP
jgi:hypothetical protein